MDLNLVFLKNETRESRSFLASTTFEEVYTQVAPEQGVFRKRLVFLEDVIPRDSTRLEESELVDNSEIEIVDFYPSEFIKSHFRYLPFVKKFPQVLEFIEHQTDEICELAVGVDRYCKRFVHKQEASEIRWISEEDIIRDPELKRYLREKYLANPVKCKIDVMMYLRSGVIGLSEIPDRFKTDDWFDDVLGRKGDYIYSAFRKVKLQDNDYFELFRRGNRILLEFYKLDSTPDHIKSHIRKRYPPFLLQDSEQQTRELCVEAIKTDPKCIQHIRKQTRSLRSLVIDIDGMTLKHIWKKDYYLCLRAVKDNGMALEFVPRRFKSPQMCFQAVRTTARALALVPDRLKTEKMCLQAVRRNGDTLEFVPDRLKTKKVCHAAVDDNPIALKYISLEDQTDEMYQLVKFNRYIKALSYVYRQTEEMCLKLVKENNLALMYVHDQTEEICIESVKNDYFSFRDIRNPSDDLVIKILEMKHECILSIKENCSDSVFKTILSICRGDLKKLELVYDKNLLSRVIETLADEFGTR